MVDYVFPQDGDYDDAENFAALFGQDKFGNIVEYGLEFTVDYGTPAFDLSEGKCYVQEASRTGGASGETRHRLAYAVHLDARTGIALTDSDVNHVFVDGNLDADDSPSVVVNTTGTAPSSGSIKIGEIDTTNDVARYANRSYDREDEIRESGSGMVRPGDGAVLVIAELADGDIFLLNRAAFLKADGSPAPTDTNLVLATLDGSGGATLESTVIAGDGATVYGNETGDPYFQYINTSGGGETVAIILDNGHLTAGSGTEQDLFAEAMGGIYR